MADNVKPGESRKLTAAEVEALARRALAAAGASTIATASLARAIAAAEEEGLASHGLAYLPTYCTHLRCGKVLPTAVPQLSQPRPGLVLVDAGNGFAHPAIDAGFAELIPAARRQGIAALAIRNSYNCGVLGYHTDRLAAAGLLGLGFTHAPASIAPVGCLQPVVGTNPIAIAVPDGKGGTALSIDQSASVIAKSEIMRRKRAGEAIPEGWAFGPDGAPTTDPAIALQGTMAPSGGYKGVGIALLVEILAAAASGAVLSTEASPFSGTAGGPPATGQFFMAIDAGASSGGSFGNAILRLVGSIERQPDGRVPGAKRAAARRRSVEEGILVRSDLLAEIEALISA
ncbi:MAG TPA: Ldh family oxidoreductase [Dongiaceae bacterium]|nr:Ldh family oxidoreductase [Dongiaceae bacterium]